MGVNYNRTVWNTGDVITATKLNNIENGIYEAFDSYIVEVIDEYTESSGRHSLSTDKNAEDVASAIESGRNVVFKYALNGEVFFSSDYKASIESGQIGLWVSFPQVLTEDTYYYPYIRLHGDDGEPCSGTYSDGKGSSAFIVTVSKVHDSIQGATTYTANKKSRDIYNEIFQHFNSVLFCHTEGVASAYSNCYISYYNASRGKYIFEVNFGSLGSGDPAEVIYLEGTENQNPSYVVND